MDKPDKVTNKTWSSVQQEYIEVYQLFSTVEGKRVLEILKKAWYDEPEIVNANPHITYYNLGKRDCIGEIIDIINDAELILEEGKGE